MALVDASSLIVLARMGGLELLAMVFDVVAMTREVEGEVITAGRAKGYGDADRVAAEVGSGRLIVIDPTPVERKQAAELQRRATGLSQADCVTIVCARERAHHLLIEDHRARRCAAESGVRCLVLQALPVYGYVWRRLTYASAQSWTGAIGCRMRTDPVVVDTLSAALAEIAVLRGDAGEEPT